MNLTNDERQLPYIILPTFKLKILIDTGSTKSFVTSEIASKYFSRFIIKDPFSVSTAHGRSVQQYSTLIDCSELFRVNNARLKFHVFDFHNYFDCLLGMDNLKLVNAIIDLNNGLLLTTHNNIKINFHSLPHSMNCIVVQPRAEQVVELQVKNIKNGEAIIPYQKISELEIPQCIAKVNNHKVICCILNPTEIEKKLDVSIPIEAESFDEYEPQVPNYNRINFEKYQFNLSKIRTDHMNPEEKDSIINLLREYSDIFHIEGKQLTFTSKIKHHIRTTDEIPIHTKSYRYPQIHRAEVAKQINDMLAQNIIRPSHSPWSSPIWVVPKKLDASGQQKWRVVVDFRKLNEKTIGDSYPLPNITDLLDKLGRCQYFTTLDLASGFHQIQMAEDDIPKTAFNSENGHYEFLRMPFGLKSAPATFQRTMENILRGINNEKCLVYLDDIIIFSTSLQEHISRLREVFDRLRNANFKIQLDKSEFLRKEVAYLGHIVTENGVRPNPDKILAIKKFPLPKNTKQIKGFLGLLGYYRRFIKGFAKITKPLTNCLKKEGIININDPEYVKCFEFCKTLLMNEPILQYPDFSKPFVLTTDASNFAIGAVLSQGKIGSDLPIAYASRTLNVSETNYSTIEKELLSIVWAVKYFRPYLFGRKFLIVTDHKPLQWLFSLKEPNSKLVRWRLKLEEYEYDIVYKKGSLNKNSDALSRIELNANEFEDIPSTSSAGIEIENLIKKLENTNDRNVDDIQSVLAEPGDLDIPINDDEDDHTIHSSIEHPVIGIPIIECPVNYGKNQLIISQVKFASAAPAIFTLHKDKQRILIQFSEANFEQEVTNFIKDYIVPKIKYYAYFEDPVYEKFSAVLQKIFKQSEINIIKCTKKLTDVVDEDEVIDIINAQHEGKTNHRGIDETEKRIKENYYWPNQRKSIQNYINNCEICQITKYDRKPLKLKYNITPTAVRPFQIIHIDSITLENVKFLTIIDSFSKYAQAYKLQSATGIAVTSKLIKYFSHHCIPEQIVSDNGLEVKNSIIKELLAVHKIKLHFISSQHPESNGLIERFHSTLIEHIRLLNNQDEYKNDYIEHKVDYALLAYNNTVHSVTNLKPYEVITGHLKTESPFNIDIDQRLMNNYILNHRDKIKLLYSDLNKRIQNTKENVISKINEDRESLPEIPEDIYVKNKQKQGKTLNKYKRETLRKINPKLKTGKIQKTHFNTTENIHLSNVKRPKQKTNKPKIISGSSSQADSP